MTAHRSSSLLTLGLAIALALGGTAVLVAQEGEEGELNPAQLFDSAKAAFGEKKFGKTLQDLNLLVGAIGKLRVAQLKAVMPNAPGGWTAEEATGEAVGQMMFGGGITVKRRFTKPGAGEEAGQSSMDLELVSDSPMVAMIAPMMANPVLLQGQEGVSVVTVKGKRAILEFKKGDKNGNLKFLLNNNTSLLTLTGSSIQKSDLMDAFGKALDLDGIEKALQN